MEGPCVVPGAHVSLKLSQPVKQSDGVPASSTT